MSRGTGVYWALTLLFADVCMIGVATIAGYFLRFRAGIIPYQEYQPLHNYLGYLVLELLILPIIFAAQGLYRRRRSISWLDHFYTIFSSVSIGTALVMVASAIIWRDLSSSRLLVAIIWALMLLLATCDRVAAHQIQMGLRRRGLNIERLLIVGTGDEARLVLDRVRHHPGMGYRPIGFISLGESASMAHGLPVLGTIEQVGGVVRSHDIHDIVVAVPTISQPQLLDLVGQCTGEQVNIKVFPDLFQFMTSGVNIGDLNGLPLVSVKDLALRGWNLTLKRVMDIIVSGVGLVVLSPLMLALAGLIKISEPGAPVFYVQERVGLDGKPFHVIKYRTMRPDAEKETGAVWASPGDPRRTWLGAFLRRYSLDEMPQLINVFIGEMSMVGPRPERPVFVEQFRRTVPRYFDRHREKAGLTGWAQVNGLRGNTSIEERTAYDLWYVENWTLWLDVKIIIRTAFAIFRDKNAY